MGALAISLSGMDVEWKRLEVIAQNIANAGSTRTATGETYRALRLHSGPRTSFADRLQPAGAPEDLAGVMVYGVEAITGEPRRVFEPGHPDADAQGFVSYPDIDHAGEMTSLVRTARAYEANLVAFNTARQMYAKALDLGRR